MAKIHQLSEDLANKIAAGEVVERPASVIKELVENSIDAKATKITIEIIEGGIKSMRIIDNGIGMSKDDALLCFSRHATSKIVDANDLFNITTLGFRGEAIPSIASISDFTLETSDGDEGVCITYKNGKRENITSSTINKGTTITVENIFSNVPARLKYLKSVNAEFGAIYAYIEKLALAHSEIAFTLIHNNRLIFKTTGHNNQLEVISNIYDINVAKNMLAIENEINGFKITGYTSSLDISRASKNHIITLVNNRYVKNKKTIDTIIDIYKKDLPDKRYPITVINIEVDPTLVDVNVHPNKLEVRFSKEDLLKEAIIESFENILHEEIIEEEIVEEKDEFIEDIKPTQITFNYEETPSLIKPVISKEVIKEEIIKEDVVKEEKEEYSVKEEYHEIIKPIKEKIYVKAYVKRKYIIGENERGLYLINVKRAINRINFEKYKENYSRSSLYISPLIVPVIIDIKESDYYALKENNPLSIIGINLEEYGKNTYIVRNLPIWMKDIEAKHFIEEMIEEFIKNKDIDLITLRDSAIAKLCQNTKIPKGELSLIECQKIADDLMRCESPLLDQNNKATLIVYKESELDSLF